MKTTRIFILRSSLFVFVTILLGLTGGRVWAQSADASAAGAQAASTAMAPIGKPVARITQAIDETKLVTLHGSVHPSARAALDQGLVPDSRPMNHILLVLQRSPEQETALRNLIDQQQIKGSPNYHAWLTPAQFAQQFGVAVSDIQQVTNWLSAKGFTEIKPSNGGMFIEFNGTAGTVRNAFHSEIHNVIVNGQSHFANLSEAQIPAALAPVVARIHSLHDFRQKSFMHLSKSVKQLQAEGKFMKPGFGDGNGLFAVGPGDLATIYNIPGTVAGSPAGQGQTVAIVARSNVTVSDITQFGSGFGIPSLANFSTNNIIVNGPDPGIVQPDDGEATLDVDMVGSAAPNANILLVVNGGTLTGDLAGLTDPTDGVDQSALYIVDNNLAPVMTQSFGFCEAGIDDAFNFTLWEQGAAQGISIFVSTGDTGSAGCDPDVFPNAASDGLQISGEASTPFNVAVGGTDFNDASNLSTYWNNTAALATAKSYIPEIPWNDTCASTATSATLNSVCSGINPDDTSEIDVAGGSGGQSTCGTVNASGFCVPYPKPSWQTGVGVPADSVRDIPDVSLYASVNSASNHFIVFCLADSGSQTAAPCNLTGQPIVNGVPSYNFSGVGGTSASSPAWAGIMALVNQSEVAAGRSGRQGNPNHVLYKLAAAQAATPGTSACNSSSAIPNSACTFNDVTIGNNSVACVGNFSTTGQNGFGNTTNPNCSNTALNGIGVQVEPSSPAPFSSTTPGWTATAGYDLATGLGSPNVTNLIANWGTVTTNFKTATPAITSPASGTVNITHGNNQSFTITVTGAGGTPTGDVALIAEPPGFAQVGVGSGTLSNGTVTVTTNMLPGDNTTGAGTAYPIIAHYAGDGTFGPADSAPINVTVNRENTTTTATLYSEDIFTGALTAASTVQYGTNYIMIVDVVGATAGTICNNSSPTSITQIPAVPCPTGTITLKDNGQPMNDFVQTGANNTNGSTVGNLGFVEDLLIQLLGGSNAMATAYSGDNSYNPSSATNTIIVSAAPTQTAVTDNGASSATVTAGQTVTLTATITTVYTQTCNGGTQQCTSASNGAGPTGTVKFMNGATTIATVPVTGTAFNASNGGAFATATANTSFSAAGTDTISATFTPGDPNYAPSSSSGASNLTLTVSGSVGSATQLAFVTEPSNAAAGVSIAPGVQVAIENASGSIVATAATPVTIAIGTNAGGGTLGGTLTETPVNGIATFPNLTLSAAGTGYTLKASATGLTGATSTTFNITPQPVKLAFLVQPSNTNTGAAIVPAVQVAIEDTNGNIVATAANSVAVAIGTNPGSGTLGGTLTATPVSGIATFSNLTISAAGTGYTLTASATGLTGATSATFNILATPVKLAFVVQPSNATANKSISPAVQVAVEDANGNVVGGATNPITVAIGTNPATGTLAGTLTVNAFNGVATFSNLNINNAGTGYTLAASAAGLAGTASSAFNITAAANPTVAISSTAVTLSSATGTAMGSTITATPSGGFTGSVIVTASTLPPGVTCPNSPLTINVTAANPVQQMLNCQVATTSSSLTAANFGGGFGNHNGMLEAQANAPATSTAGSGKGWWALSAGTGFAALFLFFLPGGRKRLHAALGLGLVCLLTLTLGCNGVGSGGGGGGLTATVTQMAVNADKEPSGTGFTFNVTVTGGTPTGTAQLYAGAVPISTAGASAAVAGGKATLTWNPGAAGVGTSAISVHYLGDATTQASQSGALNLTVTGPTQIGITTQPTATPAAAPITVTIQ